jgi:hypothetical protein
MGLILSEPIKKVVEILKILSKMSVEDAKIHPKRPYKMAICRASITTYKRLLLTQEVHEVKV